MARAIPAFIVVLLLVVVTVPHIVSANVCYTSALDSPAVCTDGILTNDTQTSDGCREVTCMKSIGNLLTTKACNKPGNYQPTYFEMYRVNAQGSVPEICVAGTCIRDNGYVKSQNFPICLTPPSINFSMDSFKIGTGSDSLELRENLGNVIDTITSSDLSGLPSGSITTSQGTTYYYQYLRLKDGSNIQDVTTNFIANNSGISSDYLVLSKKDPFIEWEIQFPDGLTSKMSALPANELRDIEDRTFNIVGTDYNIVKATHAAGSTSASLTLMGGSAPGTLREGETQTYTIDGVQYEVTLVFVSDPTSNGTATVKFAVNGEVTPALSAGDITTLSGGLSLDVRDVLVNAREGVASFFLGAKKIVISDPDTSTSNWDGTIAINGVTMPNGKAAILGSESDYKFTIASMKYSVTMDPTSSAIAYIEAGHGIREYMTHPEALLSDTLDIRYEGLYNMNSSATNVVMYPWRQDLYIMQYANNNGQIYIFPLLDNKNGTLKFGDETDDLIFVEGQNATDYNVGMGDYFIASNDQGSNIDKSITDVLRYNAYDQTTRTLTFEEESQGTTFDMVVDGSGIGNIVMNGHTYAVRASDVNTASPRLGIDLNGNGRYNDVIGITTQGGTIVDLLSTTFGGSTTYTSTTAPATLRTVIGDGKSFPSAVTGVRMGAHVLAKNFDTSGNGDELLTWTAKKNGANLNVTVDTYRGPLADNSSIQKTFKLTRTGNEITGMTDWGTYVYLLDNGVNASTLYLDTPIAQRLSQVFVVLASKTEHNILPPFTLAVGDDSPASDVLLAVDVVAELQNQGFQGTPPPVALFSSVNALDINNRVTLAIYNNKSIIITGQNRTPNLNLLEIHLDSILTGWNIEHRMMTSDQVTSSNLRDLFVNATNSTNTTNQTCATKLSDVTATCMGGSITSDSPGGCRTIVCANGANSLQILACDKPTSANPAYFEMYKQASSGNGIKICLGTTCISDNGYAKSSNYPLCVGNVTPPVNQTINYTITMQSTPVANVSINGTLYGVTPRSISLKAGSYSVSVSTPGYLPNSTLVTLNSNMTISLILTQNSTNNGTTNGTNNGTSNQTNTTCYNNVQNIPATCTGGYIKQDLFNGCRFVGCTDDAFNTLTVLACDKTGFFEMYKQTQIGNNITVCIGATCIKNSGYAKSSNYPLCVNATGTNATNQTNSTNTTQYISFSTFTPASGTINIAEPNNQTFSFTINNPSNLAVSTAWSIVGPYSGGGGGGVGITPYTFFGNYNSSGVYTITATVTSSQNNISNHWILIVNDTVQTNGTNQTNTTCFNSVNALPATCTGGSITTDNPGGCRTLICTNGASNMQVLACDKNSPTRFEMYKQGQIGTAVSKICLGTTCISDNGYASSNYPVCI